MAGQIRSFPNLGVSLCVCLGWVKGKAKGNQPSFGGVPYSKTKPCPFVEPFALLSASLLPQLVDGPRAFACGSATGSASVRRRRQHFAALGKLSGRLSKSNCSD